MGTIIVISFNRGFTIVMQRILLPNYFRSSDPNYESLSTRWKPTTPDKPCYLDINDKLSMIEGRLNEERMEFWQYLKKKYGKP